MKDEDVAKLLERLVRLELAIQSTNPDPAQTIQSYRDRREAQQRAAEALVDATAALVAATKRVGVATWALVALTAIMAVTTLVQILQGG